VTWTRVKATGSGKLAFRLEVEGLDREFVTDSSMERSLTDDRERVVGLKRKGISIEERVHIPEAELEIGGMQLQIVDVGGNATNTFARLPASITWLTGNVATSGATSVSCASTTGFPSSGVIHLNTEAIKYTGITATSFTGITRGQWGTTAQKHWRDDNVGAVNSILWPEITDHVATIEGRRAWIYVYGEGDDMQGNGTRIFTGVCLSDAELKDSATWSLKLEGLTRLLDQDMGDDLSAAVVGAAGIYYPGSAPLHIKMWRVDSTTNSGGAITSTDDIIVEGFFTHQDAFCRHVTTLLQAAATAATWTDEQDQIYCKAVHDGWVLTYRTAATPRWLIIKARSLIDGSTEGENELIELSTGNRVREVQADTVYDMPWRDDGPPGARMVPRGFLGVPPLVPPIFYGDLDANPANRVYIGGAFPIGAEVNYVTVEFPASSSFPDENREVLTSATVDADERYATLGAIGGWAAYTPESPITLAFGRFYATDASVAEFMEAVIADSPEQVNRGVAPFITSAEIDTDQWEEAVGTIAAPFVRSRSYGGSKPIKLMDMLREEWKLAGVFPYIDTDGKLALRRVRVPSDAVTLSTTLTAADILVSEGFPTFEKNALGTYSAIELKTGYRIRTDKHEGLSHFAVSVTARGRKRIPNILVIEPKSSSLEPATGGEGLAGFNTAVLGIFGQPYAIINVPVSLKHFETVLGSEVAITSDLVPNWNLGTRGVTAKAAIVVGRRFELDRGIGQLSLLTLGQVVYGYAPSFGVLSQSNTSGNTWQLTVTLGDPWSLMSWAEAGQTAETFLDVGYRVAVRQIGTGSFASGQRHGTVISVAANVVTVTFDSTWTPGSSKFLLGFADANQSPTSEQEVYVWIADPTDSLIDFTSGSVPARRFS
jgi:hypothetical protein